MVKNIDENLFEKSIEKRKENRKENINKNISKNISKNINKTRVKHNKKSKEIKRNEEKKQPQKTNKIGFQKHNKKICSKKLLYHSIFNQNIRNTSYFIENYSTRGLGITFFIFFFGLFYVIYNRNYK